jgi:hypothetical protein
MSSKHFYFNTERNNFEQQPKRKISTPTDTLGSIGTVSGTTTPKHFFGKINSSSSTSSITSCTFSVLNGNGTNSYMSHQTNSNNQQQLPHLPINPFEETNRFRLEQSVLSPNLFHVANTSTPEVNLENFMFRFFFIIKQIYFVQ